MVTVGAAPLGAQTVFFEPGPQHPIIDFSSTQAVLGDLDGDLDLDAVISRSTYPGPHIRVLLNDGAGFFFDSGQTLGTFTTSAVALGDLDGDDDLDAVTGEWLGHVRLWSNDGFESGDLSDWSSAVQ